MNKFLEYILNKRNGHYTHAIEVETAWELSTIIFELSGEFEELRDLKEIVFDSQEQYEAELKQFFNTMQLIPLIEEYEEHIYGFDINHFLETADFEASAKGGYNYIP